MCDMCGGDPGAQVIDHSIDHPFELEPDTDLDCKTCGQHISRHPDKMDYLAKREMEMIIKHGHEVRYIFDHEGQDPAFSYSIGRSVRDRPELLITGSLPPVMHQYIVNRVAELDDATPFSGGEELEEVLDGYPVRLVKVRDLEEAEMYGVTNNFGTDDTWALQILWPDEEGRFPGDPQFTFNQPVYA